MARYTDASCKLCRREQQKLFLKGEKCISDKCILEKRTTPPGEHGNRFKKRTEYQIQLREKQKAKRFYGLLEKQFKNYYQLAVRQKGVTGENLLRILESRLDNVVYRLGFALSRAAARQSIRHKHFTVNGKIVSIPSYRLKPGDVLSVSEHGKKVAGIKECVDSIARVEIPSWLEVNAEKMTGKVLSLPERDQIDVPIKETLIVELYSK